MDVFGPALALWGVVADAMIEETRNAAKKEQWRMDT